MILLAETAKWGVTNSIRISSFEEVRLIFQKDLS